MAENKKVVFLLMDEYGYGYGTFPTYEAAYNEAESIFKVGEGFFIMDKEVDEDFKTNEGNLEE